MSATERAQEFTDVANARLFAEQHASRLRYVAGLGRWYIFNGVRWKHDERDERPVDHPAKEKTQAEGARPARAVSRDSQQDERRNETRVDQIADRHRIPPTSPPVRRTGFYGV